MNKNLFPSTKERSVYSQKNRDDKGFVPQLDRCDPTRENNTRSLKDKTLMTEEHQVDICG
jgi:hypothetical protein